MTKNSPSDHKGWFYSLTLLLCLPYLNHAAVIFPTKADTDSSGKEIQHYSQHTQDPNIPVIPGATGFGINTPAGRGGAIYKVNTLNDFGPGSLRECVEASGSRICVFEVSGIIELEKELKVRDPFITIAGQTAPSPGILIMGDEVKVQTSEVLIQHISIRPGDLKVINGKLETDQDALQISGPSDNVVIDHVSLGWSTDEALDIFGGVERVTLRHLLISHPLNEKDHGFNALFYDGGSVYVHGGLFAHAAQRFPLSRIQNLIWANNLHYNRTLRFTQLSNITPTYPYTHNTFIGNVYADGPSLTSSQYNPILLPINDLSVHSRLYLQDNFWLRRNESDGSVGDQWELVTDEGGNGDPRVFSPPVWIDGLAPITDQQEIIQEVLAKAGARPANRNSIDGQIINDFLNKTGKIVDCISGCSESLGTPVIAENYIPLTLPQDPHGDDNSNGYTNVEEWLHTFSAQVEGVPTDYSSPSTSGTSTIDISGQLKRWHKITFKVPGPETAEKASVNPFLDYRLNIKFTHFQSDKSYTVPGYYAADGNAAESSDSTGNVWMVNFAPDEIGSWAYEVFFEQGEALAIKETSIPGVPQTAHREKGFFTVSETDKSGRDFRSKGFLRYVGKHHYQFSGSGEYFLKGGPDSPENLLAYTDFDNTPNVQSRRKTYAPHIQDWNPGDPVWQGTKGKGLIGALNYLAGKGLNVFSFLTMNVNGDDRNVFPYIINNGENAPQVDRTQFDISKLAQWEILFSHADSLGLYLHFKMQETENDALLDGGQLGTERKIYYRELVARFGHHLALNWNLGEETDLQEEVGDTEQQLIYDYSAYLKSIDPYGHPIVLHTYPQDRVTVYTKLLGKDSPIHGPSLQVNYVNVHKHTVEWVDKSTLSGYPWVVANDEQGRANTGVKPDGSDNNHDDIRASTLWGNLMAGGAGVEYYFGYDFAHSDLTLEDFRSRDSMWSFTRIALDFFRNETPFYDYSSQDHLISGNNSNDISYAFGKPGQQFIVYSEKIGSLSIVLTCGVGTYNLRWFNPRTGEFFPESRQLKAGPSVPLFDPPEDPDKDWVLVLDPA